MAGKAPGGTLGALGRAAHGEPREAGAAELLGQKLAHLGRADEERRSAGKIAVNAARQIDRRRGDRLRAFGDPGLAPDAARAGEGSVERGVERRTHEAQLRRLAVRRAHLTQHMRLADNGAFERARDGEQMFQGGVAFMAVKRGGKRRLGHRGARCDKRHEERRRSRIVARQLDPVAGRDQHAVAQARVAQALERAAEIGLDPREAVAQIRAGSAVVDAGDEEGRCSPVHARDWRLVRVGHGRPTGIRGAAPARRRAAPRSVDGRRDRGGSRRGGQARPRR